MSRLPFALATTLALAVVSLGCHVIDLSPRYAEGEIDIYDDLFSVAVTDDDHAVAVGYQGAVYYTDDGGKTWGKGITDTVELLYSVSMANPMQGWAVGQLGTILRTEDGGKTWTFQDNLKKDEGTHLFGVNAIDENTAWAVGEWGTRIRTRDGGKTWEDHSLSVHMLHPQFVWLSIQEQERVRQGEKVYEDVGLNDVTCLDPPATQCWIIGEFGYIFHSQDQGETWQRGEVLGDVRVDPILLDYDVIEITDEDRERLAEFAKQIADAQHLNVLVEPMVSAREIETYGDPEDPSGLFDILEARIAETRTALEAAGILSDRLRTPGKPPWDYEDFLDDDPKFLERYIESRTSEQPMIQVGVIQNPYLFTIHFDDPQNGFIAGLGGVVLRSQDGGKTWRYETMDRKQAFFAVSTTPERVIAVGEKGLIRVSADGGETWSEPSDSDFPTVFTFMRDLGFEPERRVGYIVGQQGKIMRSSDGGLSWRQVLPPSAPPPMEQG